MKINHRITFNADEPLARELQAAGLSVDRNNSIIWVANVTEDDPAWLDVQRLLGGQSYSDTATNIYTSKELDEAQWFDVSARGHHGYPQPEGDGGYIPSTYDEANRCPTCGIGGRQNAPFRLRAEPKARHSQFLQLNWVFDEFFVRSEARQGLEAAGITGVGFASPVLHKDSTPSSVVMQMQIMQTLPPALDVRDLPPVTCKPCNEEATPGQTEPEDTSYCGRVKYHVQHRGQLRFSDPAFENAPDVVKTNEWFGSGGSAFQLVLVSQRLRQAVISAKWRGLAFEPIELVRTPR